MNRPRVLFVWSSSSFSTYDVARGHRQALAKTESYDIRDYRLYARMTYHARALGEKLAEDLDLLTRCASENIVVEALRHRADVVYIVSGLAMHPDALWYLRKVGIRTVTLFTESPYNDQQQREFHAVYPEMKCLTTERSSAVDGWGYLAHAYDPEVHYPIQSTERPCDVLLIGTLWEERIKMLEQIDWTGIDLRLLGTWTGDETSPLRRFYENGCVHNAHIARYYRSAAVCLNIFRQGDRAESLNPRVYELAACGTFFVTDPRAELVDVFGDVVPTFTTASELEELIRHYLARPSERAERSRLAYKAVQAHTFDARMDVLKPYLEV